MPEYEEEIRAAVLAFAAIAQALDELNGLLLNLTRSVSEIVLQLNHENAREDRNADS